MPPKKDKKKKDKIKQQDKSRYNEIKQELDDVEAYLDDLTRQGNKKVPWKLFIKKN